MLFGRHFDYRNRPLNVRLRVCYLNCHEAGLCCYLVIHIRKLLRSLQLFYFHLWPTYWLSLVCNRGLRDDEYYISEKHKTSWPVEQTLIAKEAATSWSLSVYTERYASTFALYDLIFSECTQRNNFKICALEINFRAIENRFPACNWSKYRSEIGKIPGTRGRNIGLISVF
jgi:hypothetical protein